MELSKENEDCFEEVMHGAHANGARAWCSRELLRQSGHHGRAWGSPQFELFELSLRDFGPPSLCLTAVLPVGLRLAGQHPQVTESTAQHAVCPAPACSLKQARDPCDGDPCQQDFSPLQQRVLIAGQYADVPISSVQHTVHPSGW
jgi:hypothetical protein